MLTVRPEHQAGSIIPSPISGLMNSQALIDQLREIHLWPAEESVQKEILQLQNQFPDARDLGKELLKRDIITPYQANQLLSGNGKGLIIGPYLLLQRLGEGGMGQVFKARHVRVPRILALKVIRQECLTNPNAIGRFLKEAESAARLTHQNIIRSFEVDHVDDTYYLALELLDGINLKQLVRKEGPLDVDKACDYILQAAMGLDHIHRNGMVHRDITPGNLMITNIPGDESKSEPSSSSALDPERKWGLLKILDLGLARLIEEPATDKAKPALTQLGTIIGTADYMSPEQAISSRDADIRGDIYSLGCTFYFLLTGKPPFPEGSAIEKMLRHQLESPEPIESFRQDVPAKVQCILNQMMAKKREERYQTPKSLVAALESIQEEPAVKAIPMHSESPSPPLAKPAAVAQPSAVAPPSEPVPKEEGVKAIPVSPANTEGSKPQGPSPDLSYLSEPEKEEKQEKPEDESAPIEDLQFNPQGLVANRLADLKTEESEWALWFVLTMVGIGTVLSLILFAIFS